MHKSVTQCQLETQGISVLSDDVCG